MPNNVNNDIIDKVIDMQEYVKEPGNIVVELIILSRETDMESKLDSAREESIVGKIAKKLQKEDGGEILKTVRKWMILKVPNNKGQFDYF